MTISNKQFALIALIFVAASAGFLNPIRPRPAYHGSEWS